MDTEAGQSLISKDVLPAHWLPEVTKSATKSLYSASKDALKDYGQIIPDLEAQDRTTTILILAVENWLWT